MSKLQQKANAHRTPIVSMQPKDMSEYVAFITGGRIQIGAAKVLTIDINLGRLRAKLEFVNSSEAEVLRVLKALEGCRTTENLRIRPIAPAKKKKPAKKS